MKYELTEETLHHGPRTLYRIRALRDIPGVVKAGELGGWVEGTANLAHGGTCWIHGEAVACGGSVVRGDSQLRDHAGLYDWSLLLDKTVLRDRAMLVRSTLRGRVVVGGDRIFRDCVLGGNQHFLDTGE